MAQYASDGPTPAPSVSWTDDPLSTSIQRKAVHITELRNAITSLKSHTHIFPHGAGSSISGGPSPAPSDSWTDNPLVVGVTLRKAAHGNEIITALKALDGHLHSIPAYDPNHSGTKNSDAYSPGFTFLKDPLVAGVDKPRADVHNQLRTHIESLATHTHTACCECECTCTCTCTCTCQCQCTCTCECTCDAQI